MGDVLSTSPTAANSSGDTVGQSNTAEILTNISFNANSVSIFIDPWGCLSICCLGGPCTAKTIFNGSLASPNFSQSETYVHD
ncbi:hypothetical protein NPIL_202181 [Nephila pilipes]|uniref:Uncharacterized protein n=1 Tax=Nephila pilipes TaxID=299642 RepID=A0A8X6MUV9_NEPPI|nr:hypothetical protein NPIL_202181 [Nephila pilipes]